MRRLAVILLSLLFAAAAAAQPLAPAARTEIDSLLSRLESSGCEFNRNGTWYTGAEAKAHLLGKLKYLADKGMVQTTEQFIERAASSSSMSGQAYLVRCAGAAPVQSGRWLLAQLQAMRLGGGRTKGSP
jgi:hypothetical protein